MCNNFKSNQNEEIKSEGILIFKDTMEYLVDGILTAEQYAELTRMIYATRWGDGVNEKEIKDKLLLGIWKTLKHTIKKSARNARYRENNQNKKSTIQNITETEFDIPKPEIENKPILDTQITQDDNQYQPEVESSLNSLKMDKNEVKQNIPIVEEKPVIKIAANKQFTPTERVQELINTNDDFYTAYSRYINASISYINNPNGNCSATSKEMAKVRLQTELDKHHIVFNKDIIEMVNRDINEIIKIRNIDVA